MRFVEALMRGSGISAPCVIFSSNAAHESRDQPPAGDVVEHGELFGDRERIIQQGQRASQDSDFRATGSLR